MIFFATVQVALRAMFANKMRSILTALGIIIGVGAVIALVSIGRGVNASITERIQSLGSNLLFIRPGSFQQGGVASGAGERPTLTYGDALALSDQVAAPAISAVVPESSSRAQIVVGTQNVSTQVIGTTPDYQEVRNHPAEIGEFISNEDMDSRARVMVLGWTVAEDLFGGTNPVGREVRVSMFGQRGEPFTVIGILEEKGGTGFGNQDDRVIIPITTLQYRLFPDRASNGEFKVSTIYAQAINEESTDAAIEQIGMILRQRHRVTEDDFTISNQQEVLGALNDATAAFTLFLGGIAAISLLVGGIGIMNIMLVSVTERTREIGIRKALGAKRRDILVQFLVESITVSVIGGLIGIGLGVGVSRLFGQIPIGNSQISALVAGDAVLLAFSVALAVGLFFGIYPAVRAASLNPIDALRYE